MCPCNAVTIAPTAARSSADLLGPPAESADWITWDPRGCLESVMKFAGGADAMEARRAAGAGDGRSSSACASREPTDPTAISANSAEFAEEFADASAPIRMSARANAPLSALGDFAWLTSPRWRGASSFLIRFARGEPWEPRREDDFERARRVAGDAARRRPAQGRSSCAEIGPRFIVDIRRRDQAQRSRRDRASISERSDFASGAVSQIAPTTNLPFGELLVNSPRPPASARWMVRHHRPSADFSANSACRIASNIRDPHASVDMGPTAPLLSLLLSPLLLPSCSSEVTIRPNCGRHGGTHFSSSCTAGEPLLCRASRMNCSLLLCPLLSCPLLLWPASASAIRQSAAPNSPGADTAPAAPGAFGAKFAEVFAEVFAELAEDGSGFAPRGWKGRPERTTKRPRTACVPYRSYSALRSGAPPRSSSLPQRASCDSERFWRYAHHDLLARLYSARLSARATTSLPMSCSSSPSCTSSCSRYARPMAISITCEAYLRRNILPLDSCAWVEGGVSGRSHVAGRWSGACA